MKKSKKYNAMKNIKLSGLSFSIAIFFFSCAQFNRDNPYDPQGVNYTPPVNIHEGVVWVNSRSVEFNWDHMENVRYYEISRKEAPWDNFPPPIDNSNDPTANGIMDGGLKPNTTYDYRIIAFLNNGMKSTPAFKTITTTSIRIINPNGGISINIGGNLIIKWKIFNNTINNVDIFYSVDDGINYQPITMGNIVKLLDNEFSMNWQPPQTSEHCKIRIEQTGNPMQADWTDAFIVNP